MEEEGGVNLYEFVGNDGIGWIDYLGEKTCYRWMLITFFNDKDGSDKKNLDENDAADANRRYKPNGTKTPDFDPNADPNRPYKGREIRIHRGKKGIDKRVVHDNGAGWSYPRRGLPNGVDPEEWIDIWAPTDKGRDPEWDKVEIDIPNDPSGKVCPCPPGWSDLNPPPEPENMKKYKAAIEQKKIDDQKAADERWKKRHAK